MDDVRSMRSAYRRAETMLYVSLMFIAGVNALNIALLYAPGGSAWVLLSVGLALQGASSLCRVSSEQHSRIGQRYRHRSLMRDGLGVNVSPIAALRLSAGITDNITVTDKYYTSDLEPSKRRLVSDVAESAFFSSQIAERAGWYFIAVGVALGVLMFYVLMFSIFREHGDAEVRLVAQVTLLIFSFLGAGELVLLAYKYREAAKAGTELVGDCERLASATSLSAAESFTALAEYEVIMANCPPLPTVIYENNRERLDALWQERAKGRLSAAAATHTS